jgi:two-component sensor histidine kinase
LVRTVLARRPIWQGALWCATALALATGARLLLQTLLGDLVLFAPYYPAVLFITVLLGWPAGGAAAVLAAILANWLFVPGLFAPSPQGSEAALVFVVSAGSLVAVAHGLRTALKNLELGIEREAALNAELQHRVQNTLMVVQSIAAQTASSTESLETFRHVFADRIQALSKAHRILSATDWTSCSLAELVREALEPFDRVRLQVAKIDCEISAAAYVPLVLVLHELATNASKYGALSVASGWVDVNWRVQRERPAEAVIDWSEHGGPPVSPPTRRGFGSRLLHGGNGLSSIRTDFDPKGLRCRITAPLATGVAGGRHALELATEALLGEAAGPDSVKRHLRTIPAQPD